MAAFAPAAIPKARVSSLPFTASARAPGPLIVRSTAGASFRIENPPWEGGVAQIDLSAEVCCEVDGVALSVAVGLVNRLRERILGSAAASGAGIGGAVYREGAWAGAIIRPPTNSATVTTTPQTFNGGLPALSTHVATSPTALLIISHALP